MYSLMMGGCVVEIYFVLHVSGFVRDEGYSILGAGFSLLSSLFFVVKVFLLP
jgi:hypothetical protein